jgi:hypothetical protein
MMPEGCYTNGSCLLKFKKGAFLSMKPIKIVCFNFRDERYNLSNIGLRSLFGRLILGFQRYRSWQIYEFDAFDPAKIGLTKEEDWEKFANKTQEIMKKVLKVESSDLSFRD